MKYLLFFLLIGMNAYAQWAPEDIVNAESASGYEFSPDGKSVAWVKRLPSKEKDGYFTKLFLTKLDQKEKNKFITLQLTRGEESDRSPLFSKDGKLIYFLSSRDKGKKLWALPVAGGEPYEIKTFEQAPGSLNYLNDSTLVYATSEGKTLYEKTLEEKKDEVEVFEDTAHFKPTRVFAFDLKTKDIRRLTDNRLPIGQFAVSKDGTWLVTQHIGSPHYGVDAQPKPTYFLWNVITGEKKAILPKEQFQTPGGFNFVPDGSGFFFVSSQSNDSQWNGAGISILHFFNVSTQKITQIKLPTDWGLAGGSQVFNQGILVGLANGPTTKLAYVEKQKGSDTFSVKMVSGGTRDEHINLQAFSKDYNQLIFSYSTASVPTQVHLGKIATDAKNGNRSVESSGELVEINPEFRKKTIAKSEVIRWKGWKDEEITGILYYPKNYQSGKKYPLVVSIHGGPAASDFDAWGESWAYSPQLISQRGAFMLRPNYHGSSNHGQAFVESIAQNYYDPEMEDITKGVQTLIDKGLVNKDSMGVAGWSNGAILTTMLTVRYPDMFKVAAPGAGDVNWTSDFGTCAFGVSFDQHYFGGAPWDDRNGKSYNDAYITKSPLFELEKVKTPTIIFHGSEDRQVPRDQGHEYYRALQQIGKAPVRFLWFPGAFHGLTKITYQLRKMNEEYAWFDKYLFGTYKAENEAFKKDSPLAVLLEKQKKIATHNGLFGVMTNGILVPEVVAVKKDSIAIGRVEITTAQLKTTGSNLPAFGVTFAEAQAYCKELSAKTGNVYRLPNAKEAKILQEKAKASAASENVLNAWAGYALTRDDVPNLLKKVAELGQSGSLLKEAATYKPAKIGEAELHDLGGNVSEWYIKDDGSAGIYGLSAYDFADATETSPTPTPAYTGFRVVREALKK